MGLVCKPYRRVSSWPVVSPARVTAAVTRMVGPRAVSPGRGTGGGRVSPARVTASGPVSPRVIRVNVSTVPATGAGPVNVR